MTASSINKKLKSSLRKNLKQRRQSLALRNPSPDLQSFIQDLPQAFRTGNIIAGFSPIGDELDVWPFLKALQKNGRHIALPVVRGTDQPLIFREWTPDCEMKTDQYSVLFPVTGQTLIPQIILVPLLGFTSSGDRLGYGGGYYDRTLAALRQEGEVFACGIAYAGQEVAELPTDAHDAKLDGILTEIGFKAFA